ncbi:MAG TPA: tyrosine-protein phosphatase [Acidimicrobiia bacterium]|nr:tyrosine-protein phosphatase [Acidimicrobiia bacterium]
MTGYVNFRDLGGHRTSTGTVRTGRVFRSDSLAHCDASDIGRLVGSHHVRTVIDLRREHEVEAAPMDALQTAGVRVEHLSLIDPAVPALETPDLVDSTLAERYAAILHSSGSQFVSVLRLIADDTNHPLVFQCAVGKDRTGLVAAVLLQILGVDDDAIAADYARTAAVVDLLLARLTAVAPDRQPPGPRIMSAEAATMRSALDWLRDHHGGAEPYALAHGLTEAEIAALRGSLVVTT